MTSPRLLVALALTGCRPSLPQHGCWYDLTVAPTDTADLAAVGEQAGGLACLLEGGGEAALWACTPPDGSLFESEGACLQAADSLARTLADASLEADLDCRCAAQD